MKITIECVGKALGVLVNSGAVFPSFPQRWGDLSGVPRNVGRVSAANGAYVCWNVGISSTAIKLLHYVLAGFDLPDTQVSACGPIPRAVDVQIIHDRPTATLVEAYFEAHPAVRSRRHHALIDAEALRVAWSISTGRVPCPAWGVDAMARVSASLS